MNTQPSEFKVSGATPDQRTVAPISTRNSSRSAKTLLLTLLAAALCFIIVPSTATFASGGGSGGGGGGVAGKCGTITSISASPVSIERHRRRLHREFAADQGPGEQLLDLPSAVLDRLRRADQHQHQLQGRVLRVPQHRVVLRLDPELLGEREHHQDRGCYRGGLRGRTHRHSGSAQPHRWLGPLDGERQLHRLALTDHLALAGLRRPGRQTRTAFRRSEADLPNRPSTFLLPPPPLSPPPNLSVLPISLIPPPLLPLHSHPPPPSYRRAPCPTMPRFPRSTIGLGAPSSTQLLSPIRGTFTMYGRRPAGEAG